MYMPGYDRTQPTFRSMPSFLLVMNFTVLIALRDSVNVNHRNGKGVTRLADYDEPSVIFNDYPTVISRRFSVT